MPKRTKRDLEKTYDLDEFTEKLRRLWQTLWKSASDLRSRLPASGSLFRHVQPTTSSMSEAENEEEIEFQIKWSNTKVKS